MANRIFANRSVIIPNPITIDVETTCSTSSRTASEHNSRTKPSSPNSTENWFHRFEHEILLFASRHLRHAYPHPYSYFHLESNSHSDYNVIFNEATKYCAFADRRRGRRRGSKRCNVPLACSHGRTRLGFIHFSPLFRSPRMTKS